MAKESHVVLSMPASSIREISNIANRMKDVSHLEIGDPDFDTPPHIVEAAHRAAKDGFTHYTATQGSRETLEAVSEKFKKTTG